MALDSPYYLAVGSLVIEDGSDAGPYHPIGIWFPAPEPDGIGGYLPAVRRFDVRVTGTSAASLAANTAALHQACVRDETLYFRASGSGNTRSCRIREASVVEEEVDLLAALQFERTVTVTLTTDPYWLDQWGSWVTVSGLVPGTAFSIPAAGGDVPALLDMRVVCNATAGATGIFIGTKPAPGTGYSPNHQQISTTGTLSGTSVEVLTAPDPMDARDNSGNHLVLIRLSFSTTGDASITNRVVTIGYQVSPMVTVDQKYPSTFAATTAQQTVETGEVTLPSCALPSGATGDGYSVDHNILIAKDSGGTATLYRVTRVPLDHGAVLARGTFAASAGILYDADTGMVFIADADGAGAPVAGAVVKQPLRAAPDATTSVVVALTGSPSQDTFGAVQYRLRRRSLTATG